MLDFHPTTLGEVLNLKRGFDITKKEQIAGPFPVVSSSGVNSFHNVAKVKGPGVIIGRKGTLGKAHFITSSYWPHDTTLWVTDFKGNDPYYCYLILSSMGLEQYDVGASNPTLNRNHLHLLNLKIPSLPTQKRIAGILSAYDDLIEVNTRRIKALEEMARRTYEEWFVHYRFPGGDGIRPENWVKLPSTEAFKIKYGKTLPKTKLIENGIYPVFGAGGIIGRYNSKNIEGPTTLVTSRGAGSGVVWNTSEQGFVTNNSFTVFPRQSNEIFHYRLVGFIMQSAAIKNAVGGAAQPQLTIDGLGSVTVSIPTTELCKRFSILVEPMFLLVEDLLKQNTNLRAQRNLLLPRLISGQLDVSGAPLTEAAE